MVKMIATRPTWHYKAGQKIIVNAAMARALVMLKCAKYDHEEGAVIPPMPAPPDEQLQEEAKAEHPKPPFRNPTARKKRTYKRRDMQAE